MIAGSLAVFEHRLDPANFFRASRKHVINLNGIQSTEWDAGGNLLVTMRCGEVVALSRRQSAQLRKVLAL